MDDLEKLRKIFTEIDLSDSIDQILNSKNTKFVNRKLIWLDLGCVLEDVQEEIRLGEFTELTYLGLYANNLKILPVNMFQGLHRLQYIDLGENNLDELPEEIFRGLEKLDALWLYSNNLRALPVSLYNLHNLRELNVNLNKLNFNSIRELRTLKKLERLEVALNPEISPIELAKLKFGKLKYLIVDDTLPDGNIIIKNLYEIQEEEDSHTRSSKVIFGLITGFMGSGKSTLIKHIPNKIQTDITPDIQPRLFFDKHFMIKYSPDTNLVLFELDAPTISTWTQYISVSEFVFVLISEEDLSKRDDEFKEFLEHIIKNRSRESRVLLLVTKVSKGTKKKTINSNLSSIVERIDDCPIDLSHDLFLVSMGNPFPDLGGQQKVNLNEKEIQLIFNSIKPLNKNLS